MTEYRTMNSGKDGTIMQRRTVLGLALPIIGEMFLQTAVGVVDTLFVSWIGVAALAGVGTAQQVIGVIIAVFFAVSVGATVSIAQAKGALDTFRVSLLIRQSLLWGSVLAVVVTIAGWLLAEPISYGLGLSVEAGYLATRTLEITSLGMVFLMAQLVGGAVYRGLGDGTTPLKIGIATNVVNIIAGYVLIFGVGNWAGMGAIGSAYATVIARVIGSVWLWVGLLRRYAWVWDFDTEIARILVRIGMPAALEEVLILLAMTLLTPIVATLGISALGVHRIVMGVLPLAYLPAIGMALATTALVGQALGSRDGFEARLVMGIAWRWAIVWMTLIGIAIAVFADAIIWRFVSAEATDAEMLLVNGRSALMWAAATLPFWATCLVLAAGIRGLGRTTIPLVVSATSVWLTLGLAWLVVNQWYPHPAGIWVAHLLFFPIESIVLYVMWRRSVAQIEAIV